MRSVSAIEHAEDIGGDLRTQNHQEYSQYKAHHESSHGYVNHQRFPRLMEFIRFVVHEKTMPRIGCPQAPATCQTV